MNLANERLRDAVIRALNLEFPVFSSQSGYCLRAVREVVENAFGRPEGEFYRRFATERVEENTGETFWARDLQRSLRNQGLAIPADERGPGDLAFCAKLAYPQGHTGLLLSRDLMMENTGQGRGVLIEGFNRLTHLDELPYKADWEFFRLPDML